MAISRLFSKKILRDKWLQRDSQTHNHLVRKRTFNHSNVRVRIKWMLARVPLQSHKFQITRLFQTRSSLKFRQLQSVDSLWNVYVTDKNIPSVLRDLRKIIDQEVFYQLFQKSLRKQLVSKSQTLWTYYYQNINVDLAEVLLHKNHRWKSESVWGTTNWPLKSVWLFITWIN